MIKRAILTVLSVIVVKFVLVQRVLDEPCFGVYLAREYVNQGKLCTPG